MTKQNKSKSSKKVTLILSVLMIISVFFYIKYIPLYHFQKTTHISNKGGFSFGYYNYYNHKISESEGRMLANVATEKYHIFLDNRSLRSNVLEIGIFDENCQSTIKNLTSDEYAKYLEIPKPSGKLYNNRNQAFVTIYDMKNVPDEYLLFYTKLACIEDQNKSALIGGVEKRDWKNRNTIIDTYNYLLFRRVVETFKFTN